MRRMIIVVATILFALSSLPAIAGATANVGDTGSWTQAANAIPSAYIPSGGLEQPATAIYNGYVYLSGGYDGNNLRGNTVYAKLNTDGSVGPWTVGSGLPIGTLAQASSVALNGYVYVFSGFTLGSRNQVFGAAVNANGSLAAYQTLNALPTNAVASSAVAYNGYVYVIGGNDGTSASNQIYYAKQNTDGTLASWQTATSTLAYGAQWGAAVVFNGYVYVLGGEDGGGPHNNVSYAKFNSDGSVGGWQTGTVMPLALSKHTAAVNNGYIYVLGGSNSGNKSAVYYALINSDGSVGNWQTATNGLPNATSYAGSVANNGYLYELVGYSDNLYIQPYTFYSKLSFPAATTVLSNAVNAGAFTLTTPDGTLKTCANSVTEASLSKQDDAYSYPLGLTNVCYNTPNTNDQLTLTFVTDLKPSRVIARDYNPLNGTYVNVPNAVITETTYNGQHALKLIYSVVDNGPLDANTAIGMVSDPVGLALAPTSSLISPNTGFGVPYSKPNPLAVALVSGLTLGTGFCLRQRAKKLS